MQGFCKISLQKTRGAGPPNKLLNFHPFTKKETNATYQCDVGSFSKKEKKEKCDVGIMCHIYWVDM